MVESLAFAVYFTGRLSMPFRPTWMLPLALAWLMAALATDLYVHWHGGEALWYLPAIWFGLRAGSRRTALLVTACTTMIIVLGAGPWRDPFPGMIEWGLRGFGCAAVWGTLWIGMARLRLHDDLRDARLTLDRVQSENDQLRRTIQSSSSELTASLESSAAQKKAAEQALRESEALHHSLVDHLPLSVLRKNAAFEYTFVSRRFVEFSGKPPAEILGKTDFDLFPSELAKKYRAGDEQVMGTGRMFDDVERFRMPDGDERYIQVLKTPIRDAEEKIVGTQVMLWDVTDRERAEAALEQTARELEARNAELRKSEDDIRRQSDLLELILRSIADGVVVADAEGRFLVWNPAAERIMGQGATDKPTEAWSNVYGLYRTDKFTPYPPDELPLARAIRGEDVSDVELFLRTDQRPQGAYLSVSGTSLRDSGGQIRGGVVVFRDVSRQRAAEEEIRSKNQDLETLLYVTSHDLREPLRAIENFSRLIRDRYADKLDEKGRDFLDRVVNGAQRLDRLLDDVLTLSRVQRTTQPDSDVNANEIVDDVLRQLEPRIRETQAQLRVFGTLPVLRADRRWATQAVQNLVSNALKYTREGIPPEVEISGYEGPEGVGLIVADRGMGVPEAYAERIFGLFQRAVSRNIEGTGAGLAIVRRVAERHGGRAWVRPREGGGSEFIITFGPGAAA